MGLNKSIKYNVNVLQSLNSQNQFNMWPNGISRQDVIEAI